MTSPLTTYLNNINTDKRRIQVGNDYPPVVINKCLGRHPDALFLANSLNQFPNMDRQMHHDVLMLSLSKRKRYASKANTSNNKYVDGVAKYYNCNRMVAIQYVELLSEDELKRIDEESAYINVGTPTSSI